LGFRVAEERVSLRLFHAIAVAAGKPSRFKAAIDILLSMKAPLFVVTHLCVGLSLCVLRLAAVEHPEVRVQAYKGRPTVHINGQPQALPGYSTFGRTAWDKDLPLFYLHPMGVYFIEPPVLPWTDSPEVLSGATLTSDQISLDEMATRILAGAPDAWIIVRFTPHPPYSWYEQHPEQYFMSEEFAVDNEMAPSLASDAFWDMATRMTERLVRDVESRPWSSRVIGYANFQITEGTHSPLHEGMLFDHNPLMLRQYREHLRRKYGTDQKLQEAHGDPKVQLATADIPFDKLRGSVVSVSQLNYWQNAADNRALRDYLELQAELWHRRFAQSNEAMVRALQRNVLLIHDCFKETMQGWSNFGFFRYGKVREEFAWRLAYPETMGGSGHMRIAALFDTPGFSGLITPHDYQARGIGGVYEPEGMADSMILRGKYFMSEMDTRTHLIEGNEIARAKNIKELAAITWRNLATSITRGFNSYWMEGGAGWFRDADIQRLIDRQAKVINQSIEWEHETVPSIAMIIDDTCALETNGDGSFLNEAVMTEWKTGLSRCGVPRNIYLFDDLALGNFPKHRVYYFPNLFRLTAEKLAVLKERVFRDGVVVVWGPGSGISDGEHVGIESAQRLTGFSFECIGVNSPRRFLVTNNGHPLTRGLPEDTIVGSPLSYGPILLPTDGTVLADSWTKGGHRYTGMAIKEFGKGAAQSATGIASRGPGDFAGVFVTAVPLPANLWRNLARYAGAHVYSENNDVLLADRTVVALHSAYSGTKTILLPGPRRVHDVIAGTLFAPRTARITFELDAPETRIFRLEPEN
jgi:hypothetical protein